MSDRGGAWQDASRHALASPVWAWQDMVAHFKKDTMSEDNEYPIVELDDVSLYPPWEEGIRRFLEAGFKPGDLIPDSWLYTALELQHPHTAAGKEADVLRREAVHQISRFRDQLLKRHQINLYARAIGEGYRWLLPEEVTQCAVASLNKDIKKAFRHIRRQLSNVDRRLLNDAQRVEHADACIHVAKQVRHLRQDRRLLNAAIAKQVEPQKRLPKPK